MSADDNTQEPRRAAGAELILPVAGVLFTLYYVSTILSSPWEAQFAAFFVGSILTGLVAILVVKAVLDVRAGRADPGFGTLFREGRVTTKRAGLFAVTLAYIFVIGYLGFTITSFLYLACAMLLLDDRRRVGLIVPLAAVISLCGYLLFIVAFETRFPRGPFETLMRGLF